MRRSGRVVMGVAGIWLLVAGVAVVAVGLVGDFRAPRGEALAALGLVLAAAAAGLVGTAALVRRSLRVVEHRQRAAEETARASLTRERAILDTAVDAILTIDGQGRIQSANPAAERMFGYAEEELLGENVSMLMPAPHRDAHDDYLRNYHETGQAKIIGIGREVPCRRRDGSVFPGDLAVSAVGAGDRQLFTGFLRDLSDRKQAEEKLRSAEKRAAAAEELASVGTLVAGLAHEIGTPMGVIQGHAKLLERHVDDDRARWRLQTIQQQIDRISKIIQSLLNMARPRPAQRVPVDLEALIESTLSFLTEKLSRRGVEVVRDFEPVGSVTADPERLQQLLLNLFLNAVDAMPEGGHLTVGLRQDGQAGVRMRIRDEGVGIEADDLDRIFDAFYTSKEAGKGNGLGLMVARRIVADHGGEIRVQSEPGRGTSFEIHLPWVP